MARLRKTGRKCTNSDAARFIVTCPDYFTIEPDLLFQRAAPLEIELGAGRGDFIIGRAAATPERNFLAVELSMPLVQLLAARAAAAGLHNLRIAMADARPLVNLFLPGGCVSTYHIYFPDPWPKARHAKHRLFTAQFISNLMRTMTDCALLFVATDVPDYATSIFSMADAQGLHPINAPIGVSATGFGRRFVAEGRTIYARAFAK
jgi:tRNA (guanine-N7-)-methyltransferase